MLDYLGQLMSVTRLAAQPAVTTLRFTLADALTVPFTIRAGTQVGTQDGAAIFATDADLTIPPGAIAGTTTATATAPGAFANGYLPGQVNVPIVPNVMVASVANLDTTGGGAAPETDDHLRMRIQAAPSQFSVAGPVGAYRFFALGVDPSIIDAQVVSPAPGQVSVYVLTGPIAQPAPAPNASAIANAALLAEVQAALSADKVRPLTDSVSALAVSEVDYAIVATITLYSDADPTSTLDAANAAAAQFALNCAGRIGRDIVRSQIIAALSVAGVYEVALSAPAADIVMLPGQWANCVAIELGTQIGSEHS
jgi:phage-related baseplate assembly protein